MGGVVEGVGVGISSMKGHSKSIIFGDFGWMVSSKLPKEGLGGGFVGKSGEIGG